MGGGPLGGKYPSILGGPLSIVQASLVVLQHQSLSLERNAVMLLALIPQWQTPSNALLKLM